MMIDRYSGSNTVFYTGRADPGGPFSFRAETAGRPAASLGEIIVRFVGSSCVMGELFHRKGNGCRGSIPGKEEEEKRMPLVPGKKILASTDGDVKKTG
jgi:hypothetical protein